MDSRIESQLSSRNVNEFFQNGDRYPPNQRHEQPVPQYSFLRWRPRLTGFQLLYFIFTAGFGLSKAGLAYHGHSTLPTTFDWLYGIVIFLWWVFLQRARERLLRTMTPTPVKSLLARPLRQIFFPEDTMAF
jgi:hypothetical protein